ncbi:MAG TPA: hypothetical protein VIT67_15395 [Povalibacter sp.]
MQQRGTITQLRPDGPTRTPLETLVRAHLERLLHSPQFDASTRSREFLRFVVDQALAGHDEQLNQTAIAISVFRRRADFDAILDPIVRVQAGRLRRSLERYYLLAENDGVRIDLPKGSYAPRFITAAEKHAEPVITSMQLSPVAAEWPLVVIHLLATQTPDNEAVAARINDELTAEICRYGDIRVVRQRDLDRLSSQKQESARFELRGSLRRDGEDCLIGAHLMDRTSGEQIWSDEYHTAERTGRWPARVDDVARVIAARVGSEHGVIARLLAAECASRAATADDDAHAIHQCYRFFVTREISTLVPAIHALEQYTERRPESAIAWACLARLYLVNCSFELSSLHTPVDRAIACAHQALLLDPGSARVRCVLAGSLLVSNELQSARDELEQALRLNPDSLAYREVIGWLLSLAGDWDRGIAVIHEVMQLNPYCLPHAQHGLWADHMRRGEIEQAYLAALEYRDTNFFWRHLMMASCLGHLGRWSDARLSVASLLVAKPDFQKRGRVLIGYYIKSDALREQIIDGLRKADLPLG